MREPLICGIAGGSASGKTTVVSKIIESLPDGSVSLLDMDSYYADLSDVPFEQRARRNFDHPDSFDIDLMVAHLELLKRGQAVNKPVYSFKEHNRTNETASVKSSPVIIVEGLLALWFEPIRKKLDIKIFVDTPDDIRLIRRVARDVKERGRSLDSVIDQYLNTVRPMHHTFCEPTKRYADVIIPEGGSNEVAIKMVTQAVNARIAHN